MSLSISTDRVTGLILTDGSRWEVVGESFDLDAYEYEPVDGTGYVTFGPTSGVTFQGWTAIVAVVNEHGEVVGEQRMAGPITSVLAVITE